MVVVVLVGGELDRGRFGDRKRDMDRNTPRWSDRRRSRVSKPTQPEQSMKIGDKEQKRTRKCLQRGEADQIEKRCTHIETKIDIPIYVFFGCI